MIAFISPETLEISFVSADKIEKTEFIDPAEYIQISYDGDEIKNPVYRDGTIVEMITDEENEAIERARITDLLISAEDPTKVSTDWVKGFDLDYIILQRFFWGDRGKEIGFTQRMIYLQMKERNPEEEAEMKIIFAGYEAKEKFKDFLKLINS